MAFWVTSPDPWNLQKERKQTKRNKEGSGPSEVALRATSPGPKNKNKNWKKQETQKSPKRTFQLSVQIFCVYLLLQKKTFFNNLAQNARTPKTLYKYGVSANQKNQKQLTVTKRPFLDQKTPKPEIPVIIFCRPFLLFEQKHKKCWNQKRCFSKI